MKHKVIRDLIKKMGPVMERFGGGWFDYPPDHKLGMRVPMGGSNCAKCEYLSSDHKHCKQKEFIKWQHGNDELPMSDDIFCCDLFQIK